MTFAVFRQSTGFTTTDVAYSTNGGGAFTGFTSYVAAGGFELKTFDFSGIAAMNNNADVRIRFTFSGGTGTGHNKFDNVQFNANLPPACCLGDGTCAALPVADCTNQGGTSQGTGTTCAGLPDADSDGTPDACDQCDSDPVKLLPGDCGCGVPDDDTDSDGVADCVDACPGFDDSLDCNTNLVPDGCDITGPTSDDCNGGGVPDECESGLWVGDDGEDFETTENWDPPGVPQTVAILRNVGSSDNAAVFAPGTGTSVCALLVEATGSGAQILRIERDAGLEVQGDATFADGGTLDLRGGELSGGTLINLSNTVRGYGIISTDVNNQGLIEAVVRDNVVLRLAGSDFDNQPDGLLRATFGSLLLIESSALSQTGGIEVRTLAGVRFSEALTNSSGGEIALLGGSIGSSDPGGIQNENGGTISGFGVIDSNLTNDGMMLIAADIQVVGDLVNNGTIHIQNGILTVTGALSGSGAIIGGAGR